MVSGFTRKPDTDAEGEEKRKSAKHGIARDKRDVASDRTHHKDAGHNQPAAFQVNILIFSISIGRDGRA